MIDFNLPSYEWCENMGTVFENVDLYDVSISNENGVRFDFLSCLNGKRCGYIRCRDVWKISFEAISSLELPIFICDVRMRRLTGSEIESAFKAFRQGFGIPDSSDYYLLCMDSGEVSVLLLCGYVKTVKSGRAD